MKFFSKQTTKISSLLLLLSTTGIALAPSLPSEARSLNLETNNTPALIAEKPSTSSGFTAVGKQQETTGQVKLLKENGKRYLVFDSDFSTPNGPDVFVILHRNKTITNNIKEKNYINIARLEKFSGGQRYLIPNDVNLDDYQSIGIWCREFNVTFAFAALNK